MAMIPTSGVTMATVRDTLASYGGTVSNNLSSFFTNEAKINMWSKHKPVILAKDFCQDISTGMSNYDATWWQGGEANCGIRPASTNLYENIPSLMDGNMNGWSYALPSGGSTSPYRLGDFAGYYPDATPMVDGFSVLGDTYIGSSSTAVCRVRLSSDNLQLSFSDFPVLKSFYFGIYIKKGTFSAAYTASDTISNGGTTIDFASPSQTGQWTAYPFLSKYRVENYDGTNDYYTFPLTKAQTFNVLSASTSITITATKFTGNQNIRVVVKVSGSSTLTFTGNVRVRMASKAYNDAMTDIEPEGTISNFTVSTSTKTVYDNTFYDVDSTVYNNCRVWAQIRSSSETITKSVMV